MNISLDAAKIRINNYVAKYYGEVRPDVINIYSFRKELYGYCVSLSHNIAKKRGWQGHNWRQGIRRNLYSHALNEVDKIDKYRRFKNTICKILTLGIK